MSPSNDEDLKDEEPDDKELLLICAIWAWMLPTTGDFELPAFLQPEHKSKTSSPGTDDTPVVEAEPDGNKPSQQDNDT